MERDFERLSDDDYRDPIFDELELMLLTTFELEELAVRRLVELRLVSQRFCDGEVTAEDLIGATSSYLATECLMTDNQRGLTEASAQTIFSDMG